MRLAEELARLQRDRRAPTGGIVAFVETAPVLHEAIAPKARQQDLIKED